MPGRNQESQIETNHSGAKLTGHQVDWEEYKALEKEVKSMLKEEKRRRTKRITNELSLTKSTTAIKRAANILRENGETSTIGEDCRTALINQMITPAEERHVPNMETFEVDEELQEDVKRAINKEKQDKAA